MSSLYTVAQSGKVTIDIKRTADASDTEIHLKRDKSCPMYVVVYDLNAKKSRIYDLTQVDSITEKYPHYTDNNYTPFTSYIYSINYLTSAQHYARVFPYQAGIKPTVTVGKHHKAVIAIRVQGSNGIWLGMINTTSLPKYIIGADLKATKLNPDEPMFLKSDIPDSGMTIRDTLLPTNVAYRDLSYDERELYIPKNLTTLQINYTTVYQDWVLATDNLHRGTLTYLPTRDKDIHMVDETGNKYRYGVDQFRQLIPHLYNGVISGTFRYVGRGNRNIKYVLVPYEIDGNDLVLCDSSDSESDSDSESVPDSTDSKPQTDNKETIQKDSLLVDDSVLDLVN
jgi:hypothetical protein